MNTHAEKASKNQSMAIANGSPKLQRHGRDAFQLADNRPEAAALMKMQELANNSPQVSRLRSLQQLASNSPQVIQAAQSKALAHSKAASPIQQNLATGIAQLAQPPEVDELIQGQFETVQRQQNESATKPRENKTGLPDNLKAGIESMSGLSLDHVKVHYNSSQPAQLNAQAYAHGSDIHLAPGQEQHLPHEAWHIVQQAQGRVQPTMQMKEGVAVNDDAGLEQEADVMGAKALQIKSSASAIVRPVRHSGSFRPIQLKGVGGTKIAFEKRVSEAQKLVIDEGMSLLKGAWATARAQRKLIKDRISKDMATYDKAVKDNDQVTINRLDEENDRRNRPQVHQARDSATQALVDQEPVLKNHINTRQSDLFHDIYSMDIFGQQLRLEQLNPGQKMRISQAMQAINKDAQILIYRQQLKQLGDNKRSAERNVNTGPKSAGLTQVYFDSLALQIPDEEALLKATPPFANRQLTIAGSQVTYHHASGDVIVADIKNGDIAYARSTASVTEKQPRQVFHKKGLEDLTTRDQSPKEYVQDARGTMTRRYAYVEKNYYQMMEFFMVGHMTGRFQQYMMAGGERAPGVHKFTTKMIENVPVKLHSQTEMTDTQVAVAHQMYGSLPEQRGVSLTSTPKVGVTYANTGGNFRTDEGFKLKIDLARVPDEVLFLNHYAEGGVSDMNVKDYTTKQTHKPSQYDYKYKESAAHARELFLEEIRPEWVVEIEHHAKGGFQNVGGQKTTISERDTINLLDTARKAFGGQEYEQGFEVGLKTGADIQTLINDPNYTKGKGTGAMVKEGYGKGVEVRGKKGVCNHSVAFKEIMEDSTIVDKMSPYHLGYAQARTWQPMVTSALEFRILLNTEEEFKNSRTTGGTTSLAQDSDMILIKSSVPTQRGGFRTTLITIPFTELGTTKVRHEEDEEDEDIFDITIEKQSGEYTLSMPKAEGEIFIQSLKDAITRQSLRLQMLDTPSGEGLVMAFDTTTLKLEHQTKTKSGFKSKKSEIPLDSITSVEFDLEDKNIRMNISHRAGAFSTNLATGEAVKVRAFLIKNGLSERMVGKITN